MHWRRCPYEIAFLVTALLSSGCDAAPTEGVDAGHDAGSDGALDAGDDDAGDDDAGDDDAGDDDASNCLGRCDCNQKCTPA